MTGAVSLGGVKSQGFDVYLAASRVSDFGADVAYVGFSKVDCAISAWGSWSLCDVDCGGGRQTRTRRLLHKPRGGGAMCDIGARELVAPTRVMYKQTRKCKMLGCVGTGPTRYCGHSDQVKW